MTTAYRIACADYLVPAGRSLEAAQRKLADIERAGACWNLHTIEVREGEGAWVPLHVHRAAQILAAPCGPEPIDTPDGPMIKGHGIWLAGTVAALGNDEVPALPHDIAILTSDNRDVDATDWCRCEPAPDAASWVRYERYSAAGREAHGYVCPDCRRVTQTG